MIRILLLFFCLSLGAMPAVMAQESIDKDEEKNQTEEDAPAELEPSFATPAYMDSSALFIEQLDLGEASVSIATIASAISDVEANLAVNPLNQEALGLASELYGISADYASLSSTVSQMNNLGMYAAHNSYYDLLDAQMDNKEVLITNGETDTRPLLMRGAAAKGSYELMRMDWLDDERLRPALEDQGFNLPSAQLDDAQQIIQLHQLNPQLRIVLSPTLKHETLLGLKDRLSTYGLVFSLGERKGKSNERIYQALKNSLTSLSDAALQQSGMNYLPMLAEVHIQYSLERDQDSISEVQDLIRQILTANNRMDLFPILTSN